MLDLIQFFLEGSDVLVVVFGYAGDGVLAGYYSMVLVNGTPVDAVDAK